MKAFILLLAVAVTVTAQSSRDKQPENYDKTQWPVFFSGPVEKSVTICVAVGPNRSVQYAVSLQPATQVKVLIDEQQRSASSEPVSSINGDGFGSGQHTIAILVSTPVERARLTLMGNRQEVQDARAVRLCGAAGPPPLEPEGLVNGGIRSGAGVSSPVPTFKPEPKYSKQARKARLQGTVVLSLLVGADGRARNVRVVVKLGMGLDEKAVEAVSKWRFRPAQKDGHPVAVIANVQVNFRLT